MHWVQGTGGTTETAAVSGTGSATADGGGGEGEHPHQGRLDDYEELSSSVELALDDVDLALERLDRGTYGTCETCGAPISDDVLVVAPASRWCDRHRGAGHEIELPPSG